MIIEEITTTAFQQHTRVVGCEKTKRAICIDPGDDSDAIVEANFANAALAFVNQTAVAARVTLDRVLRKMLGQFRGTFSGHLVQNFSE